MSVATDFDSFGITNLVASTNCSIEDPKFQYAKYASGIMRLNYFLFKNKKYQSNQRLKIATAISNCKLLILRELYQVLESNQQPSD